MEQTTVCLPCVNLQAGVWIHLEEMLELTGEILLVTMVAIMALDFLTVLAQT